jgi:arylsulfatase A-like enzyme
MSDNTGFKGIIKTSYMDSTPWWPEEKKAPEGAPNIIYIVLDDTGYSQLGCYGSLVETPNIDSIATDGLRYRDFHVNAMCSPTRASLLTGCNNHTVGLGYLSNFDLGFPSLSGKIDHKYGYISETLLENGYSTFAVGKWHLCNQKDMDGAGPFTQWPLGRGFEKYYGFLNAATSQFHPVLVQDNHFVDPPKLPEEGYHLSEDLVDKTMGYIGDQKSCSPEKPFFCYLAFGAMHGPHHAPKDYIERYRGKFDEGWDIYRERVYARQKEMGLIPKNAQLTERNDMAPPWSELAEREKKIFARYMEAFAGYQTYTDDQIGRLLNYLKKIGQYDNTLIILISDNGASAEGGPKGSFNEYYHLLSMKWPDLATDEEYELIGSPEANNNYPPGWAWAGNAPLKWYKTWVHAGGVKVPLIISYPKKITGKGGIRNQYHHVIDINSTILDICNIKQPDSIKGVKQESKPGISMSYTFENPDAPRQRHVQYYEMLGNRGIWTDGWKAITNHVVSDSFEEDKWELYNTDEDFSEADDLSGRYPEKLQELVDLWWDQAGEFGVLPMLESYYKKKNDFNFNKMMRFAPTEEKTRYVLYPEKRPGGASPGIANKSFIITAYVNHKLEDSGILISTGINVGGYAMFIENNRLHFHYNHLNEKHFHIESEKDLSKGKHYLAVDFKKTGTDQGICRLIVDGIPGSTIDIATYPLFSATGGFAIGRYATSPVISRHRDKRYFPYTGEIEKVIYNLDRSVNDHDLMLELEEELKIA